ncbi:MAG: class I SAM-dependent methyltransferase [candidate division Zixibacteria bacterium]|nr:class I SAM-dependent methyltransferase [candidate division Zixibacteria bacterium]MDH3936426.1 class I SAM-dependent methyltransferase [candidate division Zixibacteria bacterium]MDH4035156.1 class I SAM-dependent methyltransferase [candidate division Zixibacteria bacterium]
MNEAKEFSFGDSSVAHGYDSRLVPILFVPWADRLIEENQPWAGRSVLDLATGTGVVAQRLSEHVGPDGEVFGVDINGEMLSLAQKRCAGSTPAVEFIECSAHPLELTSDSLDFVVCQQGFQFFPDRGAAVGEIYRVLRGGGEVVATTWRPVAECQFFGAICRALEDIREPAIADMMRIPFDVMPGSELPPHFESAGFVNVQLDRQEMDLVLDGGIAQAIKVSYSTPIGPKLKELPDERQNQFRETFTGLLNELSPDGITMGRMVSNVVTAEKPTQRS